ncbi:MAG: helix-turn-helix domain-containing protein, partial [Gemmatimonas sp.]
VSAPAWVGEVRSPAVGPSSYGEVAVPMGLVRGIEPQDQEQPPTVITLGPGMTMAEIERVAILAALRDSAGNRRKAAERLGIGERTLYRKLREYDVVVESFDGEGDVALDEG